MEWMNISYLLAFGAVFVASLSQILLKQSAEKDHKNFFAKFLNWRVILGYALMMGTTVINVFAYRGVELKVTPMIESTGGVPRRASYKTRDHIDSDYYHRYYCIFYVSHE